MDATVTKRKERFSLSAKVLNISDCRIKAIIMAVISLVFVLLLLFSKITTYSSGSKIQNVPMTGIFLIQSLFYGSQVGFNSFGSLYYIHIPVLIPILIIFQLLLCGVTTTVTLVLAFKYNRDNKISGWLEVGGAAIVAIMYLLMMTTGIFQAYDHTGTVASDLYRHFTFEMPVMAIIVFQLFIAAVQLTLRLDKMTAVKKSIVKYILLIIPTVYLFVFCLYPIFLQLVLSFKDFVISKGIWGSDWIGFDNFVKIFTDPEMQYVMLNTIFISVIRLIVDIVLPLTFSLVLFDMAGRRFRKVVQTIVYIPHFFSWVIIYAIVFAFLSPDGIINNIRLSIDPNAGTIDFLTNPDLFVPILIISSTWKEMGWGTIMYLAALSNVDNSLFEAADVDGAGVFTKLFRITLPSILPIISFMSIMAVGNILKGAGGEQILIFANNAVLDKANVIDTWVYWQGLNKQQYGLGAAVSFVQAVIGIVLVLLCNKLSIRAAGIGAW